MQTYHNVPSTSNTTPPSRGSFGVVRTAFMGFRGVNRGVGRMVRVVWVGWIEVWGWRREVEMRGEEGGGLIDFFRFGL